MRDEATTAERIDTARQRKQRAIDALARAYAELCSAQEWIASVEGDGSAELYGQIADTYETVSQLRDKLTAMKPTGLFGT